MNFQKSKVDLLFSTSGDLCLDSTKGDLADSKKYAYRALIQQIKARLMSSPGDWKLAGGIGAGLNRFSGKPNNQEIGGLIKDSIIRALTLNSFLKSNEFSVEVFPVSKQQIGILLSVKPYGSIENLRLTFSYDFKENNIVGRNI